MEEPGLLVLCGLLLADSGATAKDLLLKRSAEGRPTLLVPRFKADNLAEILGTPTALEICPADFEHVTWEDGAIYAVPGVSTIRTPLGAGKWGTAVGAGPVVFACRPHAAAGPIILCTAAVTGNPPGVQLGEQLRLFLRIAEKAAATCPVPKKDSFGLTDAFPGKAMAQAASVADFLVKAGEVGAALLLTLMACGGDRAKDLPGTARDILGIQLSEESVRSLLPLLPPMPVKELMDGLGEFGWGAHVRLLREKMEAGEIDE